MGKADGDLAYRPLAGAPRAGKRGLAHQESTKNEGCTFSQRFSDFRLRALAWVGALR